MFEAMFEKTSNLAQKLENFRRLCLPMFEAMFEVAKIGVTCIY